EWFWPEMSPDGRRVASIGSQRGKRVVWIRQLDSLVVKALPGIDDADALFWFPDSQALGVLSQGRLQRFALTGEAPQPMFGGFGGSDFTGAAINRDGVVLYSLGLPHGALRQRAPGATDGTPATVLDASREEIAHLWPQFLPDDRHFLYLALSRTP